MGWRNQPERQWKTVLNKYTSEVPMVGDCTWFGTNPISPDDPSRANGGDPAPTADWWERKDPLVPNDWNWDMARLTLNRHNRGINMTFMDGSSRKVILTDLWDQKWHRDYKAPAHAPSIPWLH